MTTRTAQSLVALQRAFYFHKTVATAFYAGAIHRTQAELLCRVTCEDTAEAWVAYARRTTVKHLRKAVAAAEDRRGVYCCVAPPAASEAADAPLKDDAKTCAPETVRFHLPADAVPLWTAAVHACKAESKASLTDSQCLDKLLDAFLAEWAPGVKQSIRQHPLIERDDWCCTVPVCSVQTELHEHHMEYRSHGGSNEPSNITTLCNSHHLKGEHEGRLHVSGVAPKAQRFTLGLRPDGPPHMVVENSTIVYPSPPTLRVKLETIPQHSARVLEFR